MKAKTSMTKTCLLATSGLLSALFFVGSASAQMPSSSPSTAAPTANTTTGASGTDSTTTSKSGSKFEDHDTNKDGSVDRTEAAGVEGLLRVFDTADKNTDGKLDRGEFSSATKQIQATPSSKK